jgi:hypothetical protein
VGNALRNESVVGFCKSQVVGLLVQVRGMQAPRCRHPIRLRLRCVGWHLRVAIPVRAAAAWDGGEGLEGAPRATRQGQGSASANASRPLTGRTRARAQRAAVCWLAYCGRLLACGLVGAPRRPDRPRREERSRARSSYIVLLLNCGWGICKKTRTLQRSLVTALLSGRADHGLSHISCMWRCGLNVGVGFVPFLNTFSYVFPNTRHSLTHTRRLLTHTSRAAEAEPPRASFIICRALTLSQRAHCLAAWSLLSVPWLDSAISV